MIKNGHLFAVFPPRIRRRFASAFVPLPKTMADKRARQEKGLARRIRQVTLLMALAVFCSVVSAYSQTANSPAPPEPSPSPSSEGGELQQITVTGYLIPRVGEGPQPVSNYDQNYIAKTGEQTVSDVLQNLPAAVGNFLPAVTTGFSFSPGSSSIGLKGLPPNDTILLCVGR